MRAQWVGGHRDGDVVDLPDSCKEVVIAIPEWKNPDRRPAGIDRDTWMRARQLVCPVQPGGPAGHRILYYQGRLG